MKLDKVNSTITFVGIYLAVVAICMLYMYSIHQEYSEPEAFEGEEELAITYKEYKNNPFVATYCRRAEWLMKLYYFRQNAFRESFDYADEDVKRWDERIYKTEENIKEDILRFKRYSLEPPSAEICQYIW